MFFFFLLFFSWMSIEQSKPKPNEEMRPTVWIFGSLLLLTVVVMTLVWTRWNPVKPSPPGQLPLEDVQEATVQWPSTLRAEAYRPTASSGEVTPDFTVGWDTKRVCGIKKECLLPTVPLGPQYTPTLLLKNNL